MKHVIFTHFILLLSLFSVRTEIIAEERISLNFGEEDWRFTKEEGVERELSLEQLSIRKYKLNNKRFTEICFKNTGDSFQQIRIQYTNDVFRVRYRVESSSDNFEKEVVQEYASPKFSITAEKYTSEVSDVSNTVGFVKKLEYRFNENTVLNSNRQYWRIIIPEGVDSENKPIAADIKSVQLVTINHYKKKEVTSLKFDDSEWEQVGLPHSYNDTDSYLNVSNADAYMWLGDAWYRRRFSLDKFKNDRRFILEFQGITVASCVYINGVAITGNSSVTQPDDVTNVGSFLPFSIDITDYLKFDQENIIAVRVSNSDKSFYTYPNFGVYSGFGMGFGGIVAPVYLHVLNPVHVAPNVYGTDGKWGVYVATTSANAKHAVIKADIQVCNDSDIPTTTKLVTTIYDPSKKRVTTSTKILSLNSKERKVLNVQFDIDNPTLWYPNNSPYGKPAIYQLQQEIYKDGICVDKSFTHFGIRIVTWDDDYCYINGNKHILRGFGYRNTYPALGAAIPDELYWRDAKYMADCGANTLRVGHVPASKTMVEACDYYGIMIMQNSGDNEWSLFGEIPLAYKAEYDKQLMINQRNNPSIIIWESNNGFGRGKGIKYGPERTHKLSQEIDYLSPRIILNRDAYPNTAECNWNVKDPIVVGYSNGYKKIEGAPTLNTEVYGARWDGKPSQCIARFDFDNEKSFSKWYIDNYLHNIENKACGWIDWMLAETQGEGYTIYLNNKKFQKSLGSSAMDGNRFPKLKYEIYKNALWVDYNIKPGVALQTNWNEELNKTVTIDAWSNCEEVELFVGDKSYGRRTPNKNTKNCAWENVLVEDKPLKAIAYGESKIQCTAVRKRAGAPYAVELSVEEPIQYPNGKSFITRANASDVILVTAKIVDKNGVVCPFADHNITFELEGNGVYKGSYNFYCAENEDKHYHAPGDLELQAEGGLMKVAIRSTNKAGKIKVKVKSSGLRGDEITLKTQSVKLQYTR